MSAPTYWDCYEEAEVLYHGTIDEAVEAHLDDVDRDEWPEKIEVFGFTRQVLTEAQTPDVNHILDWVEGELEEYASPEDPTDFPESIRSAATALSVAIVEDFPVWTCERTHQAEVEVLPWVKANRPDWLKKGGA